MKITRICIDLAKNVFHRHDVDTQDKTLLRASLV